MRCVPNMLRVLLACREVGLPVFFAPHHRWRDDDLHGWMNVAPIQKRASDGRLFEAGSWGGTFRDEFTPLRGEVVVQEHWCSSAFANTDLDLQLKKHGIGALIVIGVRGNTCIDSTVRFAAELGYDVTLVKDAIASFSWDEMRATLDLNAPNYASSMVTTDELLPALAPLSRNGLAT